MTCLNVNAAIVSLSDNFDSESPELNSVDFLNWDVIDGTVDTVANGGFGIQCAGNAGNCIDLDGSTFDAGIFITKESFLSGTYLLSFDLAGSFTAPGFPDEVVTVEFGDYQEIITVDFDDPYVTYTSIVNVTGGAGSKLSFSNAGGDDAGAILDNVFVSPVVSPVPVPAAVWLFATALLGLAGFGRRRKAA